MTKKAPFLPKKAKQNNVSTSSRSNLMFAFLGGLISVQLLRYYVRAPTDRSQVAQPDGRSDIIPHLSRYPLPDKSIIDLTISVQVQQVYAPFLKLQQTNPSEANSLIESGSLYASYARLFSANLTNPPAHIVSLLQRIDGSASGLNVSEISRCRKSNLDALLTYHSLKLENYNVTQADTDAILDTAFVHASPLTSVMAILGHKQALAWLGAQPTFNLSSPSLQQLHSALFKLENEVRPQVVGNQLREEPIAMAKRPLLLAQPPEIAALLRQLDDWTQLALQPNSSHAIHPIVAAAWLQYQLAMIHPFAEGNGVMSRLLANDLLIRRGYPPALISSDERASFLDALFEAGPCDAECFFPPFEKEAFKVWPLVELTARAIERSLELLTPCLQSTS